VYTVVYQKGSFLRTRAKPEYLGALILKFERENMPENILKNAFSFI
jgi:hypothetical protein